MYLQEDMLIISGIQHYVFCPRQWALLTLDRIWEENELTTEGKYLHQNVDNPSFRKTDHGNINLHRVGLVSQRLGFYGIADNIELIPTSNENDGLRMSKYSGTWIPVPVEYKRGHKKSNHCDEAQVVLQALCLEEMYDIKIPFCQLYYGETHHRVEVEMNSSIREFVTSICHEMHQIFSIGQIPKCKKEPKCRNCSIIDLCMPALFGIEKPSQYIKRNLYEETS